jgi:signal transduction histidine kinase
MVPKSSKQARDLVRSTTEVADEIIREVRTISHSGSGDAIIRVVRSDAGVRVEIKDHGKGMPRPSGPAGEKDVQLGVGTAGMRERVAQLGGTFEIKSAPAKGTIVTAILPAADRQ